MEFLFLCNFALFVNTETYSQYYTELCNHASNVGNVCTCSQGPRVPQLMIPSYPALSHPPPQLEGHVWYPVRGEEEGAKGEVEEGEMMDSQHIRGVAPSMPPHTSNQHFPPGVAPTHYHPQNPSTSYYYTADGQPVYNGGAYPPIAGQGAPIPAGVPMAGGMPGQAGGPPYYPNGPHPTHGLARPDTRSGSSTTTAGDAMLSSPQVGVM